MTTQPTTPPIMSYDLIADELKKRGCTVQRFTFGKKHSCFTFPSGASWFTRNSLLTYPFISGDVFALSRNKQFSQTFVKAHGISVPETLLYPDEKPQLAIFLKNNAPLVVKPLNSSASRGITRDIANNSSLQNALKDALMFSDKALVQSQFFGQEIRMTVINGVVVNALLRQTARVVGDGTSTIEQLIRQENSRRRALKFPYITYPELTPGLLSDVDFSSKRVLDLNEVMELSKVTLISRGASLYNITDSVHEDYKSAATTLSNLLSPKFFIVDMLVADYTKPITPSNHVFLEFTLSPALKMYYSMRGGEQYDIVPVLVDMIEEYCA